MQAAAKHKFPRCGVSKSKMLSCYISIRCIPTMTNEDEILENPCKSFITVITCRPAQTNIKSTGQYTVPPIPADLCRLQQVHELLFGICPLKIIQSFNHSITQSLNCTRLCCPNLHYSHHSYHSPATPGNYLQSNLYIYPVILGSYSSLLLLLFDSLRPCSPHYCRSKGGEKKRPIGPRGKKAGRIHHISSHPHLISSYPISSHSMICLA